MKEGSTMVSISYRSYFPGSSPYDQLLPVLKRISKSCSKSTASMLIVCFEQSCTKVFCENCEPIVHDSHRAKELRILLVEQKKRTSIGEPRSRSLELLLDYLKAAFKQQPSYSEQRHQLSSEIEYYKKVLRQSRGFDVLANTAY